MFVTAGERMLAFSAGRPQRSPVDERLRIWPGLQLVAAAKALVTHVTRARVPMPKSTREFLDRPRAVCRGLWRRGPVAAVTSTSRWRTWWWAATSR